MSADDPLANLTVVGGHKVLPPCVILDRLGGGGMGTVYKAFHITLKYDVAVKVLNPQIVLQDPTLVERFKGEARKAVRIKHQNVISVSELCEHSGFHFIVMELVLGRTVRQRVRDRKQALGIGEALQITYEAAMGLAEAHRAGIIHRDMKPDNLLVGNDGKVKVADLGLAKATLGGGNSLVSSPNQVMGTPAYMPPEQWESAASTATDVWALGATMWFMLAGRDAITDPDNYPARMMKKILMNPFPDIRDARPDVPDDVAALLAKATSRTAEDRFQDCAELEDAIAQLKTPRTPLRDRRDKKVADEANTMVSPVPLQGLEEVERWLREDMNTRIQTPGRMERDPVSGRVDRPVPRPPSIDPTDSRTRITPKSAIEPVPAPEPAPAAAAEFPPKGDTRTQPRPQPVPPPSRRWLVAVLALIAAGGGYTAWEYGPWRSPRRNGDPLALVIELEDEAKYSEAIDKLKALCSIDQQVAAAEKPRLVKLFQLEAARRADGKQWASALEQLTAAADYTDDVTRPTLESERTRLYDKVRNEVVQSLKLTPSPLKVKKGEPTDLVAEVACDAVAQLRLAGVPMTAEGTGRFKLSRSFTNEKRLEVAVLLVDKKELKLDEREVDVDYVADPVALQLTSTPETVVGDVAVLTEENPTLRCRVLGAKDPKFTVDGKSAEAKRSGDEFVVTLGDLVEGQRKSIELGVADGDATPAKQQLTVVKLAKDPPPPTVVEPKDDAKVTAIKVALRVKGDEWTNSVVANSGAGTIRCERDGTLVNWTAELTLRPGLNEVEVATTNVAGRTSKRTIRVQCSVVAATFRDATLMAGGMTRRVDLADDPTEPIYVSRKDAQLEITCVDTTSLTIRRAGAATGTAVVAREDGKRGVALAGFLAEGEVATLELVADNASGQPTTKRIAFTLDTIPPAIDLRSKDEGPVDPSMDLALVVASTDAVGVDRVVARIPGQEREQPLERTRAEDGWLLTLKMPQVERTIVFVAYDKAGNASAAVERKVRVRPATPIPPTPEKLPRGFEGFEATAGARPNANGYPDEIRHVKSTVVLVAIDWAQDKNPTLYAAVTETTEFQYDGVGDKTLSQGGVNYNDVADWFKADRRGAGLRLPTDAEWKRIVAAKAKKVVGLESGFGEWVETGDVVRRLVQPFATLQPLSYTNPLLGFRAIFVPK